MVLDKVYVIVVTFKGRQWYHRCFSSLRESTFPVETIVVDNASGDGSVEYIREVFPEVHVIPSEKNLGFGQANNVGIRFALDHGCDFVFLLNQDAWIEPDTFSVLLDVYKAHPEFAILSPMHMTKEKDQLNFLLMDGNNNLSILSDFYFGKPKEVYEIEYVNAAAWLLPRSTLLSIGGFCPMIYHYGEDDDYLNRVSFHQKKVGLCPASRIVHDSKHRLAEGQRLFEKANLVKIEEYLDITKSLNFKSISCHYIVKSLICIFKLRFNRASEYWKRWRFIRKNRTEIEFCRSEHRKLKPNWLI